MTCRKCGSKKSIKNGLHLGRQLYKCKCCNFQYTRETPKGISPEIRAKALLLYVLGMSMRSIARMYNVEERQRDIFYERGVYRKQALRIRQRKHADIILMHQKTLDVIKALPAIIEIYRKEGYEFVTIEEL